MHSYENRMRAIALYIKLGMHVGATMRALGNPAKNTLTGGFRA